jgi:hypothetical protein
LIKLNRIDITPYHPAKHYAVALDNLVLIHSEINRMPGRSRIDRWRDGWIGCISGYWCGRPSGRRCGCWKRCRLSCGLLRRSPERE